MSAESALLGLAAGDVLGAGVEGFSPSAAAAALAMLPASGTTWTDDTQQALIVARHVLENGSVDPVGLAVALRDPAVVHRRIGPGFARFLASGEPQPSAGNGAAMRATPLGIRFGHAAVIDEAIAAGLVTHADPRGVAAGVAVAVAVDFASHGVAGADLLFEVADDVTSAEHQLFSDHGLRFGAGDRWHTMSEAILAAVADLEEPPTAIAGAVGRRAVETSASAATSGTDPYAASSVVTALAVAASADDPILAVRDAVALGGDADTVGAITGAVVGARFGVDAWPWEVPKAGVISEIGRRLAAGEGARGLPDTADLVT